MSSLGKLIKEARRRKGLTHQQIAREIKIKETFLKAIEKEDWLAFLVEPVTVRGFVKNYASFLELDQERIMALFNRDFPLKIKLKIKNGSTFFWSPQTTAVLTVAIFALGLIIYLLWQYFSLKTTPYL